MSTDAAFWAVFASELVEAIEWIEHHLEIEGE